MIGAVLVIVVVGVGVGVGVGGGVVIVVAVVVVTSSAPWPRFSSTHGFQCESFKVHVFSSLRNRLRYSEGGY